MSHIKDFMVDLTIGAPMVSGRLTLYPLLKEIAGNYQREPGYLTLDEALAAGFAKVTEVSEAGSVPELLFRNSGDKPVLLLDGEELVGAKQNRILNLSILAPAHAEIKIPVSCVEQNRWGYRGREFRASDRTYDARGRAEKVGQVSAAMASVGAPRASQGSIWANVAAAASRLRVSSPTAAMSDVYEYHRPRIDPHVEKLSAQPRQVGAIVAVDGKIVGMDLFDAASTYAKLAPKLLRSYALETADGAGGSPRPEMSNHAVRALLAELQLSEVQRFPAVGLGEDWRLQAPHTKGAALVHSDTAIHICAFAGR